MTPGQLLKATREAGPMSLDDIAKQLRLSVDTVCDIERDDYAKIGVRTFVRGYLCSYARLVSVSEAQILEALDASGLMPSDTHSLLPRIEGAPVMNVTHQHFRKLNPRLISIVCISALTLIILIAWLHTPKDINTVKLKTQNNSLALSPPFLAPAPTTTSTVAIRISRDMGNSIKRTAGDNNRLAHIRPATRSHPGCPFSLRGDASTCAPRPHAGD